MSPCGVESVGDAMVRVLAKAGVQRAYTVPGESFLPILDGVERNPEISLISTRHESGAAFMAEADAKLTGIPAVAMATRGVGASNLAIGVHTARQDSTPMLVLLGQVETSFIGREAFQEVDLPAFYGEITKWSATVPRADRLPEFVARGLRIATSGRPGPVMLAVPSDLLEEDVAVPNDQVTAAYTVPAVPRATELDEIARQVVEARQPVLIAGGNARDARQELVAFAEAFGVGVYAAFRRQDVFPNEHPHYLGHLTLGTPPATLEALDGADLVLVVGSRLDEVTTQSYSRPRADQAVICIDVVPEEAGARLHIEREVVADPAATLRTLVSNAPSNTPDRKWVEAHRAYLESSSVPEGARSRGLDPARVVGTMRRILPEDAIVTSDAGNFSVFLHRYWRHRHPRTQLAPASGAMGYGIPAAVAAKLACPERCVVCVAGDGGLLMTGQELETAVRYGTKIIAVVLRNGMHGTIAMHQMRSLGRTAGVEIGPVDLAAYARSFGASGSTVQDEVGLESALQKALDADGPVLVEAITDPDLITPTARLSEISGGGGSS